MKARLLFNDHEPEPPEPEQLSADVVHDLGLTTLLNVMASGDAYLRETAHSVLLADPLSPEQIRYRQDVLADCLRHPDAVRELYQLAETAAEAKRRVRVWSLGQNPSAVLARGVAILRDLSEHLEQLHAFALAHRDTFASQGLRTLCAAIEADLADPYLSEVRGHLHRLAFEGGVVLTASLAPGCTGTDYRLRRPARTSWWARLVAPARQRRSYTYRLPLRDDNGDRTLSRIRDQGINSVADATAQSADHVLDFFHRLRFGLGFYMGCLNLHEALSARGVPTCLPGAAPTGEVALTFRGLVDTALAVRGRTAPVGNDLEADGKSLILVTGANQGGKSTLLRALGLAQMMLDAGMFVTAVSYRGSVSAGVITHYRREEDAGLQHGKLDDELVRMSELIDRVQPGTLVLLDESFASTNEREGSELATTLVDSLLEAGVRVYYVTHLYALAHSLVMKNDRRHLFLRAERDPDGRRTFHVRPGAPETTSYAYDLFHQLFPEEVG